MKEAFLQHTSDTLRYAREHGIVKTLKKGVSYAFALIGDIFQEQRFGSQTGRVLRVKSMNVVGGNKAHSTQYAPTPFNVLRNVFDRLDDDLKAGEFIDFGCGRGRVLLVALQSGFARAVGVEFCEELCDSARANLLGSDFDPSRFQVVHADATQYEIPRKATVLYFYNPFDDVIMEKVMGQIRSSLAAAPRKVAVVYTNPVHGNLFEEAGFNCVHTLQGAGMPIHIYLRLPPGAE